MVYVITIKCSVEGMCYGKCGSGSKVCAKGNVNLEGVYVKGNVTVWKECVKGNSVTICGRNICEEECDGLWKIPLCVKGNVTVWTVLL